MKVPHVCVAVQYYSIPWRQDLSNSNSSIPAALSLLLADLLNQGVVSNLTNVSVGGTVSLSQPPLQFVVCVPINPCKCLMGNRCLIMIALSFFPQLNFPSSSTVSCDGGLSSAGSSLTLTVTDLSGVFIIQVGDSVN